MKLAGLDQKLWLGQVLWVELGSGDWERFFAGPEVRKYEGGEMVSCCTTLSVWMETLN